MLLHNSVSIFLFSIKSPPLLFAASSFLFQGLFYPLCGGVFTLCQLVAFAWSRDDTPHVWHREASIWEEALTEKRTQKLIYTTGGEKLLQVLERREGRGYVYNKGMGLCSRHLPIFKLENVHEMERLELKNEHSWMKRCMRTLSSWDSCDAGLWSWVGWIFGCMYCNVQLLASWLVGPVWSEELMQDSNYKSHAVFDLGN